MTCINSRTPQSLASKSFMSTLQFEPTTMAEVDLHNVLVTGGDSFIGYHIVSKLLQTQPTCEVSVLDTPTSLPRFPSVSYHDVDVSDKPSVLTAIQKIKPQVIFHAACTYSLALPSRDSYSDQHLRHIQRSRNGKRGGNCEGFRFSQQHVGYRGWCFPRNQRQRRPSSPSRTRAKVPLSNI